MSLIADLEFNRQLHLQSLGDTLTGGVPTGLPDQLGELTPFVSEFDKARATIEADANLTAAGKWAALQTERDKVAARIETWRTAKTAGVTAQMAQLQSTVQASAPGAPEPTEAEVTAMARRLEAFNDPEEVIILHIDADERRRVIIERASETIGPVPRRGPDGSLRWQPLLAPERIAQVRAARQAQAHPEATSALSDLQQIENTYSAMASAARALVTKS